MLCRIPVLIDQPEERGSKEKEGELAVGMMEEGCGGGRVESERLSVNIMSLLFMITATSFTPIMSHIISSGCSDSDNVTCERTGRGGEECVLT